MEWNFLAVLRDFDLLLSHTHLDHIEGLAEAHQATGATVLCHPGEVETASGHVPRTAVKAVAHEEKFFLGASPVVALHAPGHTRGSVCFYMPQEAALIAGDVVFVGSVGRTDLPGGDPEAMRHTLNHVIASLPGETKIYPGHDYGKSPTTTLEWELATNPAFSG